MFFCKAFIVFSPVFPVASGTFHNDSLYQKRFFKDKLTKKKRIVIITTIEENNPVNPAPLV